MASIKVTSVYGVAFVKPCSLVDLKDVVICPEIPLPGDNEPSDDIFPE